MPSVLRNVAVAAIETNSTCFQSAQGLSREVRFAAGVAQGEPLSPLLFNIAIDFIIEKLNSTELREECGYDDGDGKESVLTFADDNTDIGNNIESAQKLLSAAESGFVEIGLSVNASKTKWLSPSIVDADAVLTISGQQIKPTQKQHDLVRYLGAHFSPQHDFDGVSAIQEFQRKFECVLQTTLLQPNQKLQLIKQYLMPTLNFTFQVTPLGKIPDSWLRNLDLIITNGLRELLMLPNGSCNAIYYAPCAMSGLAMTRFMWEARLQRLLALPVLLKEACAVEKRQAVLEEAMRCFGSVQMETSDELEQSLSQPNLASKLRQQLRMRSFDEWASMRCAGNGARMYQAVAASNRWIQNKSPLTLNEWLMAIQLRVNACAVYSHPRMQQQHDSACRRCHAVRESIGHVIGSCEHNMGLITNRHNAVVRLIADELRRLKYTVYEERRCIGRTRRPAKHQVDDVERDNDVVENDDSMEAEEPRWMGTSRRIDIVAVSEDGTKAFLLDPTICIEYSDDAVEAALLKKKTTYEPTIDHFRTELAVHDIQVHGLWFGSRGAHHNTTVDTFKRLGLMKGNNSTILDSITKLVLKHSTMLMRNHLSRTALENSSRQ